MAVIDDSKNKKPFLIDRDDDVFIGLKLPLVLDNGNDSSTKTTLEAVTTNIRTLLLTELGERVMQPTLGIQLKKFLFEQFTDETTLGVKSSIADTLGYWMPFVKINDIRVNMSDDESGTGKNTMEVAIDFSLKKDITTVESIQVNIGE